MQFSATYATHYGHAINNINEKRKIEFNSVTKYDDMTNKQQFFYY